MADIELVPEQVRRLYREVLEQEAHEPAGGERAPVTLASGSRPDRPEDTPEETT